ncbi:ribosomal protein S5 domain 2-like protein [Xylariomycetidae sp. FL0641]|nr:ribosomal protein S5 domain 2-like protein [Xylariomycetidae sp. FL0641]
MATQSSMTLSSATFAKLSPHPYLLANLQPPDPTTSSRTNGRQPGQARAPHVNTSSLTHAHGSAVVRTGDTSVICGVRGETLLASDIPNYRVRSSSLSAEDAEEEEEEGDDDDDELRDYDLLVPNIELATGCAPEFLPGVPPSALAQTLSTRLYSLLHSARVLRGGGGSGGGARALRIYHERPEFDEEGRETGTTAREVVAYWVLYIDVLFVSLDGNPFDAAWAAVLAALRDTKLPVAYWDPDREAVLCARAAPVALGVAGLPVASTAAVFTEKERRQQRRAEAGRYWILVDPDRFEESLCDETVTVVVDRSAGAETKVLGISKSGGTIVGPQLVRELAAVAEARWDDFKAVL